MIRFLPVIACLALATTPACGADDGSGNADPTDLEPPPECALSGPPGDWTYPPGPYGTEVGETFENIQLDDCDGEPVDVGEILAQSQLTLFNVGAGWCEPCVEETATLDEDIFRAFCGRGLRVVQVLFEDDQSSAATKLFCGEWRERYSLSFPVLVDPLFTTQRYFERAQTPVNFLIDPSGEILYKETGTPAADLPQRIDMLLER